MLHLRLSCLDLDVDSMSRETVVRAAAVGQY